MSKKKSGPSGLFNVLFVPSATNYSLRQWPERSDDIPFAQRRNTKIERVKGISPRIGTQK